MRTTRSGESALLLLDAVNVLVAHKINYAVVGAIAASIHGAVRASMDADVVLSLAVQQAKELEQAFKVAGFFAELSRGDIDDPIPALLKLADGYGNRVDLLVGLRGMEADAFSRVVEVPFQGERLRFIGREDFIAMKAFLLEVDWKPTGDGSVSHFSEGPANWNEIRLPGQTRHRAYDGMRSATAF